MWVLYFTEAQGWNVKKNVFGEDHTSRPISLAKNGKRSSGGQNKTLSLNGVLTGNQVSHADSMVLCPGISIWGST